MVAMSGGVPPWTAGETIFGTVSPAHRYFILIPRFAFLNGASTASNDFCSAPVHLAMIDRLPLTPCALCAPAGCPGDHQRDCAERDQPGEIPTDPPHSGAPPPFES